MRDELLEALNAANDDPEVGVVVLKAAGEKAFCAGADLSEFLTARRRLRRARSDLSATSGVVFYKLKNPIIAALHGYGAGFRHRNGNVL